MDWKTFLAFFLCLSSHINSQVVPPESMHVMVGQDATFSCGGEALAILWFINDQNIDDLGIKDVFERVEDFRTSNITVSGVVEYHNASIQCVLYLSTPTVTIDSLAPVFLTVFGIGPVLMLRIMPNFPSCVQWDEPVVLSDDVTNLLYNVSLSGADLMLVTTADTEYCPQHLTPCQEYTVTVTPFSTSPDYTGSSNTITITTPGNNSHFQGPCIAEVEFENTDNVTCSFTCPVVNPEISCPVQYVHVSSACTLCFRNDNGTCMRNSSVPINGMESSIIIVIAGLCAREMYYAEFAILDQFGGIADTGKTHPFSTFSVQNANITHLTGTSKVTVTCFFAKNAPASACMAFFDNDLFGFGFNGSVHHSPGSLLSSGVIEIPQEILQAQEILQEGIMKELSNIVFDVKVFDVYMDGGITDQPAFEQLEALKVEFDDIGPNPVTSLHFIAASSLASTSMLPPTEQDEIVAVAVSIMLLLAVAIVIIIAVLIWILYSKRKKDDKMEFQVMAIGTCMQKKSVANSEIAKKLDKCIQKHAGSGSDDAKDIGKFYKTNREHIIRIVELFAAEEEKEGSNF